MTLLQIIIYIQTVNDNSAINDQALVATKAWFENKINHRELEIHDFGLFLLIITHFIFHFWKYQCVKWEETRNRRFSFFALVPLERKSNEFSNQLYGICN